MRFAEGTMMTRWPTIAIVAVSLMLTGGCVEGVAQAPQPAPQPQPQQQTQAPQPAAKLDPAQVNRLKAILPPLLQKMDRPIPLNEVKVGILNDPHINAANAGGGEFYVTVGLLQKANDDHLRAIMAHEVAHADLGHVAKAQVLGAGLNIGIALLDQILPGSSALTPVAGELISNAYSRKEENEADAHAVTIMRRAGFDGKALMANSLRWLAQTEGDSGGGFFATHPATGDRVQAVMALP
jgi:Zn-dependent protease with chaperone function